MQANRITPQQRPCFGCEAPISDEPGNYYCPDCIAEQTRQQADERAAFDAFHAYADRVAKA
jgi:Zn finger protein HypA/HybF involved in hydrogenase expression